MYKLVIGCLIQKAGLILTHPTTPTVVKSFALRSTFKYWVHLYDVILLNHLTLTFKVLNVLPMTPKGQLFLQQYYRHVKYQLVNVPVYYVTCCLNQKCLLTGAVSEKLNQCFMLFI